MKEVNSSQIKTEDTSKGKLTCPKSPSKQALRPPNKTVTLDHEILHKVEKESPKNETTEIDNAKHTLNTSLQKQNISKQPEPNPPELCLPSEEPEKKPSKESISTELPAKLIDVVESAKDSVQKNHSNQQTNHTNSEHSSVVKVNDVPSSVNEPPFSDTQVFTSDPSARLNFFQQCKPFPTAKPFAPTQRPGSAIWDTVSDAVATAAYIDSVTGLADFVGQIGLVFKSVRADILANIGAVRLCYERNRIQNEFIHQLVQNETAEFGQKKTKKKSGWFGGRKKKQQQQFQQTDSNIAHNSKSNTLAVSESDTVFQPLPPPPPAAETSTDSTTHTTTTTKTAPEPPMSATMKGLLWSHRSMCFFAFILRSMQQEYNSYNNSSSNNNNQSQPPPISEDLLPAFREAYDRTLAPHMTWVMKLVFKVVMTGVPTRSQFVTLMQGQSPNHLTEPQVFRALHAYLDCLDACNGALRQCFLQNGYTP